MGDNTKGISSPEKPFYPDGSWLSDNESPLVSIIVLTLNSEPFIFRCLSSLARQTFERIEVIVVDAGSTDATKKIVAGFEGRFKFFELQKSSMGDARNYGISLSRGDFICFLDSDDFFLPNAINRQLEVLRNNVDADVAVCSAWFFRTQDPTLIGLKRRNLEPSSLLGYLQGRNHNLSTMMFRRAVFGLGIQFDTGDRGRFGEEWRLQIRLAIKGVRVLVRDEPLSCVELRTDSHTNWDIQWKMKESAVETVSDIVEVLPASQKNAFSSVELLDSFRLRLAVALIIGRRLSSAQSVVESLKLPSNKTIGRLLLVASRIVPASALRRLLITIWMKKQNRTFVWRRMPIGLDSVFFELQRLAHR